MSHEWITYVQVVKLLRAEGVEAVATLLGGAVSKRRYPRHCALSMANKMFMHDVINGNEHGQITTAVHGRKG